MGLVYLCLIGPAPQEDEMTSQANQEAKPVDLDIGTNPTPADRPDTLYLGQPQPLGPTLTANKLGGATYSFGW